MVMWINKRTRVNGEHGFTLIELLVVVIIIAILAAIAIPMYLSQREKGWEANAQSDLRNAAVAQESYYVNNQSYADAGQEGLLTAEGFNVSADVTFAISVGDPNGYCMTANHNSGGRTFTFDSTVGAPEPGANC